MSCRNCCAEFSLFKKEYGCESCGFAFCGKCCNKKTVVNETAGKSKQLLCGSCFNKLSGGKSTEINQSSAPPSALEKRLAFGKHSFSLDTQPRTQTASGNMNEKDKEIAERLQRLKRERNKELLPSQLEIEERLAKLKGMDPAKYTAPPIMVYRPADKRTSYEHAADLIKEVEDEVKIDSSIVKPEDEIAERLARLRGFDPPSQKSSKDDTTVKSVFQEVGSAKTEEEMDVDEAHFLFHKDSGKLEKVAHQGIRELNQNEEFKALMESMKKSNKEKKDGMDDEKADEEEEANKLIAQLMSSNVENEMEDPESLDATRTNSQEGMEREKSEESDEVAPEEFPWCVICTEDARMRCFGCDGDLYCMRCFRECHDSLDIKDHKTCPFLTPKM